MTNKVYIDGANVAHEDGETIICSRIEIAINEMEKIGLIPHALLPNYMLKKILDPEIVEKLKNDKKLSLISNDDDEALITVAYKKNAFFLTNDRFKDHKKKEWWSPKLDKWIESMRIPYEFIEGNFSIPMSVKYKLDNHLKNSKKSQMSLSEFKMKATNGGISLDTPTERFPDSIQQMLNFILKKPDEITIAELGSKLKNKTGCKIKDLFGNSKNASRFLKSQGFKVRCDNNNFYVL
ncbi:MAG: hypothetical protein SCH70_09595 [Candidatus Methanoperedens sp.]|nr:hypothetical protein [Candidatus Methanoperedens sp.]